jgi:hypothetical protein
MNDCGWRAGSTASVYEMNAVGVFMQKWMSVGFSMNSVQHAHHYFIPWEQSHRPWANAPRNESVDEGTSAEEWMIMEQTLVDEITSKRG